MKIGFIDALFILLFIFVLLPHKPDEAAADDTRAGDLVIEIRWPECQRSDVDLWVKSPGDRAVGYSRLRGKHVSLLRDDLGTSAECGRAEMAASRVLADGEWIVNLHLYSDRQASTPIPVNVKIWYRRGQKRRTIWRGVVDLLARGQEVTAVRWRMTEGALVPGSIHHTDVALRSAGANVP